MANEEFERESSDSNVSVGRPSKITRSSSTSRVMQGSSLSLPKKQKASRENKVVQGHGVVVRDKIR